MVIILSDADGNAPFVLLGQCVRGSVGSKIIESAIDYSFNTPAEDLTRQGLYEAILPHCKHADSAYTKTNSLFPLVFAIANEMNFEAASAKIKELPLLEKEAA